MAHCAYRYCNLEFQPKRRTQRFHHPDCKRADARLRAQWSAHPCPYCTTIHEPDEPTVLEVLERLVATAAEVPIGDSTFRVVLASELQAVIRRRRAILHPAEVAV